MLLAIDPGKDTGWALFSHISPNSTSLICCGLGVLPSLDYVSHVIIERPQIYPKTSTKQANDLITLAITVGRLAEKFSDVTFVLPHTWKGSVPKDIHHARIWAKLSPLEQEIVHRNCLNVAPSKRHNLLDAIGLGIWALKR